MNRTLAALMLAALLPATAGAENGNAPSDIINMNDDLGYRDDRPDSFYLQLEHPLPLLPNARLSRSGMDESASGQPTRAVIYGASTFTHGANIDSTVQVTQTDIILYYNILKTVASVDVGVDARHLDSSSSLAGNEPATVSGWVPMLYAGIGVDLPVTGLSIGADGSFAGYQGSRVYDLNLRASYTTGWRIGADLGYRYMKLNQEDFDASSADIEFDGPYAGLSVKF